MCCCEPNSGNSQKRWEGQSILEHLQQHESRAVLWELVLVLVSVLMLVLVLVLMLVLALVSVLVQELERECYRWVEGPEKKVEEQEKIPWH